MFGLCIRRLLIDTATRRAQSVLRPKVASRNTHGAPSVVAAFLLIAVLAPTTSAQGISEQSGLLINGDLVLSSEYNWRGLTRVNDFVLQPNLSIAAPLGSGEGLFDAQFWTTAGVWANFELSHAGAEDLADRAQFGLAELNPWLQLGVAIGDADLALGFTRYYYRGEETFEGSRSNSANTSELFLSLSTRGKALDTKVSWWLDVDRVRGSYFETSATAHIQFLPVVLSLLHLGGTAGWSAGQGINSEAPGELANFESNGLTHLAFSLSTSVLLGPVSIEPGMNFQVNRDEATRRLNRDSTDSLNVWWTLVVSPTRTLRIGEP